MRLTSEPTNSVSRQTLAADFERALSLARQHLPEATRITAVFDQGWRHVGYEIDREFVLKVPRPNAPDELEREALVLRHVHGTPGLPVPRLVGAGTDPAWGFYTLTERVPGVLASDLDGRWPEAFVTSVAGCAARSMASVWSD